MGSHATARVLVVDDDEATVVLVGRMLTRLGYRSQGVLDGKEALRCLGDDPDFHLVLTDINMPGMDGWELARRIHERHPRLPVLALTGLNPEQVLPRMAHSPIRQTFFKPLSLDALRDALASHLEAAGAQGPDAGRGDPP